MKFYEILEVEQTATKDEIKKSYRRLAMQYHPDRNKWDSEAEKKFKEINEAYSTLSDDSKRKQYDMFWESWSSFGWFSWWVDVDFWDIFESFFGGGFSSQRKRKTEFPWEDIQVRLNIDLKTSIFWWEETIKYNKKVTCQTCDWEGGSWKKTCPKCAWKWVFTKTSQSIFWMVSQTMPCDECGWTWEVFEKVCPDCSWEKRILEKAEYKVKIPAWIDNSMIIKIQWEWNHWVWTKQNWSLLIQFIVNTEEKWLKREAENLYFDIEIEIVEAVLWIKKDISIPIIWKRKIEIPAWTSHWSIIKIKWDWVKFIENDKKWDLFIKILIKIPKKISKKERELYEEIAKIKGLNVNSWGILDKIFG